jgi:dye decolorizing peroxidase
MTPGDNGQQSLNRREFLAGASALAVSVGIGADPGAASGARPTVSNAVPKVALGGQPAGLPARQHAWTATLAVDDVGDPIAPRFDRLLFFDVRGRPTPAYARLLEASLRTLERLYHWGPAGLLFTVGWGPTYFDRVLGVSSPIPPATGLSSFESPAIDDYHLCLHLACDDERRLAAVEAALLHGERPHGAKGSLQITDALRWRETRTGFVGTGLPAARQDVSGIPPGDPVAAQSPLFMGFKSGLRKNQATENYVTIADGPFAGGTTMQVSYMRLRLDGWYEDLSYDERVARMYSPETTPEEVTNFTTDAESEPNLINQAIRSDGVIGHSQTSALARVKGKPRIIRRDFNTVDGGHAGLHFVSVQRSIADFVVTRNAMNASGAHVENPAITDTANNGINEFMSVLRRANYILPSRAKRSFPLLRGREAAVGRGDRVPTA